MKKINSKDLNKLKKIEYKELKKRQLIIKKYQLQFERESQAMQEEYLNALNELIAISEDKDGKSLNYNKMTEKAKHGTILLVNRRINEIKRDKGIETIVKDEIKKMNVNKHFTNFDIYKTKNKISSLKTTDKQIKIFKKMIDNFFVLDTEMIKENELKKIRVLTGINIIKQEKDPFKAFKRKAWDNYKNNQRFEFSKNIWRYNDITYQRSSTHIANALYSGNSPRSWYKDLKDLLVEDITKADYKMLRLARTETSFIQADITETLYKTQDGYSEYVYIAEPTACEICKALDGQVFKIKDLRQGINHYPLHPNCVCSSAMIDIESYK